MDRGAGGPKVWEKQARLVETMTGREGDSFDLFQQKSGEGRKKKKLNAPSNFDTEQDAKEDWEEGNTIGEPLARLGTKKKKKGKKGKGQWCLFQRPATFKKSRNQKFSCALQAYETVLKENKILTTAIYGISAKRKKTLKRKEN